MDDFNCLISKMIIFAFNIVVLYRKVMKTYLNRQRKKLCICEVHLCVLLDMQKQLYFNNNVMVLASFKNILIKCQTLTVETRISPNSFSSIKCFKCRPTIIFAMHLLQIQCHDR